MTILTQLALMIVREDAEFGVNATFGEIARAIRNLTPSATRDEVRVVIQHLIDDEQIVEVFPLHYSLSHTER
jgi:hypothetical protein